jgi:hypothetical protein
MIKENIIRKWRFGNTGRWIQASLLSGDKYIELQHRPSCEEPPQAPIRLGVNDLVELRLLLKKAQEALQE